MIKGVNRQVLEFSRPECEYFERILFFVKPECAAVSEGKLRERAAQMAKDTSVPPPSRVRRSKWLAAAKILASASTGALITALVWWLTEKS